MGEMNVVLMQRTCSQGDRRHLPAARSAASHRSAMPKTWRFLSMCTAERLLHSICDHHNQFAEVHLLKSKVGPDCCCNARPL